MINKIETQILEKITPTKEYRLKLESTIKNIKLQLGKEIRERNLPASIELVGSTAKDTYLKNDLDIDFFLKFPANIPKEEIAKNTLLIGKKILKETEESYAEHPYIKGFFDKFLPGHFLFGFQHGAVFLGFFPVFEYFFPVTKRNVFNQ